MSIVKIPKKVQGILAAIRNGQVAKGLEQLDSIKGLAPQKALVRAEINYFRGKYEEALDCDEQALLFDEQWYAGNILTEHLFAYSNAAIISNNTNRASRFLTDYLIEKEKLSLPDHRLNFYRHQVAQHLKRLAGEQNLPIEPRPLSLLTVGEPLEIFATQLREYRPKLAVDSAAGADYLLHFMFQTGATAEALNYYHTYASEIRTESHHLNAARLYAKLNDLTSAQQALLTYAAIAWFPVEHIQVAPMRLWEFNELSSILTQDLREKILALPKSV